MATKYGTSPASLVFNKELSKYEEILFNFFVFIVGMEEEKKQAEKINKQMKRRR